MYLFGKEQFIMETSKSVRFLGKILGEPHFGLRIRLFSLDALLKNISDVGTILDVGSAKGQTAFYLANRFPNAIVHGIDINPDLVNYCNHLAVKANLSERVHFSVMDVSSASVSGAYDLITCMDVIEHIPNWQGAITNLVAGLKSNGNLFVHTLHRSRYLGDNFGLRKLWYRKDKVAIHTVGFGHVHEHGFSAEDFDSVNYGGAVLRKQYTFGPITMFLHTIFEAYRGRPRYFHFFLTPLLTQVAKLELRSKLNDGGGILLSIKKA